MFSVVKTNIYFVVFDIVVKNKSSVVKRGLYSCRQWYASLQWSKCCATNWATSQSARFASVIEHVSSIHPWVTSRCWISQSGRALWFSYVITMVLKTKLKGHWHWILFWVVVLLSLQCNSMQSLVFRKCNSTLNTSPKWAIRVQEFSELCNSNQNLTNLVLHFL